jgi:hypothetical protein
MRQGRYLNVILTVNAALLSALVWNGIAERPLLSTQAHAQGVPEGVPNAGMRRQQVIDGLRDVRSQLDGMRRTLESGAVKVQVTNLDELKVASTK